MAGYWDSSQWLCNEVDWGETAEWWVVHTEVVRTP